MFGLDWQTIAYDALWFIVIVGWLVLIMTGLEADKPLSGGLPGQVDFGEAHSSHQWNSMDHLGSLLSWVVFGSAALLLPVILWWIFTYHGK